MAGQTPLYRASAEGHANAVECFLTHGAAAEIEARTTPAGVWALYIACHKGHTDVVAHLLQYRAAVDGRTSTSQSTCLAAACENGRAACVSLLLTARASVTEPSGDALSLPLHSACLHGANGRDERAECVHMLLEANAPIEACNAEGSTALGLAAEAGHVECMQ